MAKMNNIIGWIGVGITIIFSGIWAYWGTVENFHEGWYSKSVWENLFMFVFQYLLFTILFVLLAAVTLTWKILGLLLHLVLVVFCVRFFSGARFGVLGLLIVMPVAGLGLLYYFGEPEPKKLAYLLLICVPLMIITAVSIPQGMKVSRRINDKDFGTRIVEGNGVTLIWAQRGPGWPDKGTTWEDARRVCRYLSADGTTVMVEEQNIWKLPTADEAVRSMMIHGENAGGVWHAQQNKAVYDRTPDKETPLWDVYSKVIYYWTSETDVKDERRAYIIVYHGGVFSKMKTDGQDYLSFRAVKETNT